ncbi:MAG: hypothetical protein BGO07_01425 [Alphaproteobacteria bacterium 40-19]|nr:MAG: hypothetical protein BGO07_01425 [Alphaproteobacteria bacterium 40-19]
MHEEITEKNVENSIFEIQNSQKNQNYMVKNEGIFIPGVYRQEKVSGAIKEATDSQRYKTIGKWASTPINHTEYPKKTSLLAVDIFQEMQNNPGFIKPIDELNYRQVGVAQGVAASSFDPRTFYGILSYIKDHTNEKEFQEMPPLKTFYDPCGGWGKRFFSALL